MCYLFRHLDENIFRGCGKETERKEGRYKGQGCKRKKKDNKTKKKKIIVRKLKVNNLFLTNL